MQSQPRNHLPPDQAGAPFPAKMRRTHSDSRRRAAGLLEIPTFAFNLWCTMIMLDGPFDRRRRRRPAAWEGTSEGYSLSLPPRFETEDQAYQGQLELLFRLAKAPPEYDYHFDNLIKCVSIENCRVPYCQMCGRNFRRWAVEALTPLALSASQAVVATILHDKIPCGQLATLSPSEIKAQNRATVLRAGFPNSMIFGGLEVAYKDDLEVWISHSHWCITDPDQTSLDRLRELCNQFGSRSVFVQQFRDPLPQISYLTKFFTYHRPMTATGERSRRAFPLPKRQLFELLDWYGNYDFEDFLFLFRARRMAGRVVTNIHSGIR